MAPRSRVGKPTQQRKRRDASEEGGVNRRRSKRLRTEDGPASLDRGVSHDVALEAASFRPTADPASATSTQPSQPSRVSHMEDYIDGVPVIDLTGPSDDEGPVLPPTAATPMSSRIGKSLDSDSDEGIASSSASSTGRSVFIFQNWCYGDVRGFFINLC